MHVTVARGEAKLELARYKVKRVSVHNNKANKRKPLRKFRKRYQEEEERRRDREEGQRERLRRNDPDRIDHEKLQRLRALREQVSRSTEPNETLVSPGDASRGQPLQTITLDWEIFPPGTLDEVVQFFSKGIRGGRGQVDKVLRERIEASKALQPEAYIRGIGGFDRYIGAKLSEDLVIFENMRYGNALYIVYEKWEYIVKKSRVDLLQDTDAHFDRIIHAPGWRGRLEEIVRREQSRRGRMQMPPPK